MDCPHFTAGRCRSCTWLPRAYPEQVVALGERARAALNGMVPEESWETPVLSSPAGFRNKAKMVVSGTADQPILGITDENGAPVDLADCGLYPAVLQRAFEPLREFIGRAGIVPYDVTTRRGELKFLLVTVSPDDEFMVRFVLRSQEAVTRIRKHLPWLLDRLPAVTVVSVNIQPVPAAVLEGDLEIVLTQDDALPMRLGERTLLLPPRSFFQTNTHVAHELYRTAARWADEVGWAGDVVDLYCGVGGFAMFLARPGRSMRGVETSADAIAGARAAAVINGIPARFEVGDAAQVDRWVSGAPHAVVVNPPRRGIGADLADWLERSGAQWVLYSSCNPTTLARDLAAMPSFSVQRARLLDMFPHTAHAEVLVLAQRC